MRTIATILLLVLFVTGITGALLYFAYKAEVEEGLRVGAASLYIYDKKTAPVSKRTVYGQGDTVVQKIKVDARGSAGPSQKGTAKDDEGTVDETDIVPGGQDISPVPTDASGAVSVMSSAGNNTGLRERENTDNAPDDQGYGFTSIKETFKPSTSAGTKQNLSDKQPSSKRSAKKDISLKLSGDIIPGEFLAFGIYNSLAKGGSLLKDGAIKVIPSGGPDGEELTISFTLYTDPGPSGIRLPLPVNGEVSSSSTPQLVNISRDGILKLKNSSALPSDISYTVKRMTGNWKISQPATVSGWMSREFDDIPGTIKERLDVSRGAAVDYKLLILSGVMNRVFGYQKGIIPVTLPRGVTWTRYISRSVSENKRLLCDCDVMATYAFIFSRYLGMDSVILIGFENAGNGSGGSLGPDEYHAVLYVNAGPSWIIYDPTRIAPDMTAEAENITDKSSDQLQSGPGQRAAKTVTRPKAVNTYSLPESAAGVLGEALFSEESSDNAASIRLRFESGITSLDIDPGQFITTISNNSPVFRIWLGITAVFLAVLSLVLALSVSVIGTSRGVYPETKPGVFITPAIWKVVLSKIFLLLVIAGFLMPVFMPSKAAPGIWVSLPGFLISVTGIAMLLLSKATELRLSFQDTAGQEWSAKGIFTAARHPDITGYGLICAGSCLFTLNIVSFILSAAALYLMHSIAAEADAYNARRYGSKWEDYARSTPAYMPRKK